MKKYILAIVFLLSFLAGLLLFLVKYFHFPLNLEQLIWLFAKPLQGTDNAVLSQILIEVTLQVLLPSFILAMIVVCLPKIFANKYAYKLWHSILNHSIAFRLCVAICLLFISFEIADKKFSITEFVNFHLYKKYSNLYEEHYAISQDYQTTQAKPKNLIVIIAESLESTYSSKNIPNRGGAAI